MLTWAPNLDYTQPGMLFDVTNAWPTNRGYERAEEPNPSNDPWSFVDAATENKGDLTPAVNLKVVVDPDSLDATYTTYLALPKSVQDNVTGTVYTAASVTSSHISLVPFQGHMFIGNADWGILKQTAYTGAAAAVASSPKPLVLLALDNHLVALNCANGSGGYGTGTSRMVMTSQLGNPANWNPTIANQSFQYELEDDEGAITAGAAYRSMAVIFKRTAVYIMEYVGGDTVFAVRKVSNQYGCVDPRSIVEADGILYFYSEANGCKLCAFDGATVRVISEPLGDLTGILRGDISAATDGRRIYWNSTIRGTSSDTMISRTSTMLVYHIASQRFGKSAPTSAKKAILCVASRDSEEGPIALCNNAGTSLRTSSFELAATPMTMTTIRQQFGAKKMTQTAVSAETNGEPATVASMTVTSTSPTGSTTAQYKAADGVFTHAPISAKRIQNVVTFSSFVGSYIEVIGLTMHIAGGGKEVAAPPGTMQ